MAPASFCVPHIHPHPQIVSDAGLIRMELQSEYTAFYGKHAANHREPAMKPKR
jgi:hypothetical protein